MVFSFCEYHYARLHPGNQEENQEIATILPALVPRVLRQSEELRLKGHPASIWIYCRMRPYGRVLFMHPDRARGTAFRAGMDWERAFPFFHVGRDAGRIPAMKTTEAQQLEYSSFPERFKNGGGSTGTKGDFGETFMGAGTALSASQSPSGFSVLAHSRAMLLFFRFLTRLNNWGRPLLPCLYVFMAIIFGLILVAVVFANQHVPCWYDEICMLDPAYHRATTGVWHSIANWDSIDVVPFAPNYPLLINTLRFLIACFGVHFWILRGSMLAFGIVPIATLLWLFRPKGILRSWREVVASAYLSACFTFFHWSVSVRPEAVLLTVVALLVFAWADDHPVLLFFSAFLVPLCGLQWNVLLLPVALHWLVFGGRLRNPLLVAAACGLSTAATIVAYHALGMWPSYLQEAARVGGLDVFHNVSMKMRGALAYWNWSWLVGPVQTPFYVIVGPIGAWALSALSLWQASWSDVGARKLLVFVAGATVLAIFFLGLVGHLLRGYVYLLALPTCLLFPVLARRWFSGQHSLWFIVIVLAAPLAARVHWVQIANGNGPWGGYAGDKFWVNETNLEELFGKILRPDDIVCCDNAAYYALRRQKQTFYLLRYAFSIDSARAREITALLIIDPPWVDARVSLEIPNADDIAPNAEIDSPGIILARLSRHWHCTFSEVFLEPPTCPNAIRYRLFRPVFQDVENTT